MKAFPLFFYLFFVFSYSQQDATDMGHIKAVKTSDFEITGNGKSNNWDKANWVNILQRSHLDMPMETKVKVLYSETGIYFLFWAQDPKINATITEDGKDLWTEDVVELFIWPDTSEDVYFEYELSPLNYELPLMIMNINGKLHRWQPWYFEDNRNIQHKTTAEGGEKESGSTVKSWTAEIFIPYTLLSPMKQVPPKSGTEWKVNFNRMDYLNGKEIYWSWQDLPDSFHEIHLFGTLIFK